MKLISAAISLMLLTTLAVIPTRTVQADFGSNWTADVFSNPNLTGGWTQVTGIDAINHNWGSGSPILNGTSVGITNCPSSPTCTDNFSIRFTSTETFAEGWYEFYASSDDGIRILIDGNLVLDRFVPRAIKTDIILYEMTAGTHNLTVEYFEGIDNAVVQVQWLAKVDTANAAPDASFYVVRNVPLTWNPVSWATGYEVQVSKTPSFEEFVFQDDMLSANTLQVTTSPLPDNVVYYWRVRAKKPSGMWATTWSAIHSFRVNAP
jgi:hypothetical protein